ncbi:MAG: HAMP domain-containing histidine kinase [Akkermansia sp.]|nr:HAMP domain-containing histidine kinase [Akkermansia sp.]
MNKKLTLIITFFTLLTLSAAAWLAYETATLDTRLLQIDKEAQQKRLVELSLPRIQEKIRQLLEQERQKLGYAPPIGQLAYAPPTENMPDYVRGYFLLTPAGLQVPEGQDALAAEIEGKPAIIDTIRRKAFNPAAPVYDPTKPTHQTIDPKSQLPIFGVYEAEDQDFSSAMEMKGEPGPFYSWYYIDDMVYMRNIRTTHGSAAEGIMLDAEKLAAHLLPLVEPALKGATISLCKKKEPANLFPLPMVLRPGDDVEVPDTAARREAMRGTLASATLVTVLAVGILFGLLFFYARMERRRADFVSAVTHELRTPLTSFSLMTEMLKNKLVPAEKLDEYHETLHQESQRLGHLVENVLAFARLTRGKLRGRADKGTCPQLINRALEKVQFRLKEAGFRVQVSHDKRTELLNLNTDIISLEQIFTNLADNAIKYAATAEHPTISISTMRGHDTLSIRFADNGPGIPPKWQRGIFRPFSRSAKDVEGRKPGVGLGLALSRDVARSLGGNLVLEKSNDKGTAFTLTLPLN